MVSVTRSPFVQCWLCNICAKYGEQIVSVPRNRRHSKETAPQPALVLHLTLALPDLDVICVSHTHTIVTNETELFASRI